MRFVQSRYVHGSCLARIFAHFQRLKLYLTAAITADAFSLDRFAHGKYLAVFPPLTARARQRRITANVRETPPLKKAG